MATMQRNGPADSALSEALGQVSGRLRWKRVIRDASRGVLIAVALAWAAIGFAHWDMLPDWLPLELLIPLLLAIGLLAGLAVAYARPIDRMAAARLAESRLCLKERLSSALEFERSHLTPSDPESSLLRRMQQEDAASYAQRLQAADAVPLSPLPWEARAVIPALVVLCAALLLPTLPIFIPPALRAERAVVQKSGQNLSAAARRLETNAQSHTLPATKRAAQKMQALSRKMRAGHMTKKQAMVQMSQLRKEMADAQKDLAQSGPDPSQASKTLDQAGRELSRSLPSSSGKPNSSPGATPEVQQAEQAMQRNDASGLSDPLQHLAEKIQSGKMSPTQQKQAAQDLQKLSSALKGTSQSEAQRHVQAAADALQHGDQARAADELRRAANAAQRDNQRQQDAQGLQQAQQTLQNNEQQMAQAEKPGDVPRDSQTATSPQSSPSGSHDQSPAASPSGQQGQSGKGKPQGMQGGTPHSGGQPGQSGSGASGKPGQGPPGQSGQGSVGTPGGAPSNADGGNGKSAPSTPGPRQNTASSGQGQATPGQNTGIVRGAAHPLDPKFDPTKNPKYGKVFLGAGTNDSGAHVKSLPGAKSQPGTPAASVVPYTRYIAPARKAAEAAVDKEDVPPSYRSSVRRYFDAIQPPAPAAK